MRTTLLAAALLLGTLPAFAAVDINQASLADLDGIKGMSGATSRQIVQERAKGPYTDWQNLMTRVKGIKPAKANRLSAGGLTVNGTSFVRPSAKRK